MPKKLPAFIRRRWRTCAVLAVVGGVLVALTAYAFRRPPVIGPPIRVVYSGWRGTSPGAGYIHTSAWAVELDLERGRWRRVHLSAAKPQKMLSPNESAILRKLRWRSWQKMDEEHYGKVRAAVQSWIANKPPARLSALWGLGREDGAKVSVVVTGRGFKFRTDLCRGGFAFNDPAHKLWNELTRAIDFGTGKPLVINGVTVGRIYPVEPAPH